jgi:hypothetical protein
MKTLTENLNTILDNFQSIVGSGMTTSFYETKTNPYGRKYSRELFNLTSHRGSVDIDIQSDFDGLYPIDPWTEQKNYCSPVRSEDRRSKEILMETPVSDKDKELLKEWFLSGGDVKNYRYREYRNPPTSYHRFGMDRITWWRFTKGLLWKFYNYLLVNLEDQNLETIDPELSVVLMDMIFDLTSRKGERQKQDELYDIGCEYEYSDKDVPITRYFKRNGSPQIPYQYKTLQEWYGDPETKKVEREIEELKKELERKEMELESLVV